MYELPGPEERTALLMNLLGTFVDETFPVESASMEASGLSQSEIDLACRGTIKAAILEDKKRVSFDTLIMLLRERHAAYSGREE